MMTLDFEQFLEFYIKTSLKNKGSESVLRNAKEITSGN